jgi:hypothetical protein
MSSRHRALPAYYLRPLLALRLDLGVDAADACFLGVGAGADALAGDPRVPDGAIIFSVKTLSSSFRWRLLRADAGPAVEDDDAADDGDAGTDDLDGAPPLPEGAPRTQFCTEVRIPKKLAMAAPAAAATRICMVGETETPKISTSLEKAILGFENHDVKSRDEQRDSKRCRGTQVEEDVTSHKFTVVSSKCPAVAQIETKRIEGELSAAPARARAT